MNKIWSQLRHSSERSYTPADYNPIYERRESQNSSHETGYDRFPTDNRPRPNFEAENRLHPVPHEPMHMNNGNQYGNQFNNGNRPHPSGPRYDRAHSIPNGNAMPSHPIEPMEYSSPVNQMPPHPSLQRRASEHYPIPNQHPNFAPGFNPVSWLNFPSSSEFSEIFKEKGQFSKKITRSHAPLFPMIH